MFNLSERRELKILVTRVEIIRANVFLIGKIKHKKSLRKKLAKSYPEREICQTFCEKNAILRARKICAFYDER